MGRDRNHLFRKSPVVPLGKVHIYTAIGTERDAFGFEERTLLLPDWGGATLRVDHAVTRQVEGRSSTTQDMPYQTGMVGIACQLCHLPIGKHFAIGNGGDNTIDILSKLRSINGHSGWFQRIAACGDSNWSRKRLAGSPPA